MHEYDAPFQGYLANAAEDELGLYLHRQLLRCKANYYLNDELYQSWPQVRSEHAQFLHFQ